MSAAAIIDTENRLLEEWMKSMRYVSTRGEAPVLGFADALLAGLARDGGLYVPQTWPALSPETIASFAGQPYWQVAETVIAPFVNGEIAPQALRQMIKDAYASFKHPAVAPLVQIGDGLFVQELFHGPTLAFKDVAMQLLGRLMDHILKERGRRATIVGATSGDTGSAAIEAFRGLQQVDIVIMYPHGRVSPVQRRQMTTVAAPNVHAIALEGNFDDCQTQLKAMFNHLDFRDQIGLSGVNSINWARIVAQIVYYFTAAAALGAPQRRVSFTVPTGNFGDIFAGYVAKRMGLPVDRLLIATNVNDILTRSLATGRYQMRGVVETASPSMDIQISSNFERLLFDACGRDSAYIRSAMGQLSQSGAFEISPQVLDTIRAEFDAGRADQDEVDAAISKVWRECGYLVDPHTAVGIVCAWKQPASSVPMVVLGTAHPAKFPAAVKAASGIEPPLPENMADLYERPERFTVLPNDQATIEAFIRKHARAVQEPST